MAKMHYKITGADYRKNGQTEFEYTHQAACGYVRDNVTTNGDDVDCELCIRSIHMVQYHAINKTGIY
jgi:hypothetical protein